METLYGVTLGVNYGDTLVFGKRTQEKKATLLFGAFVQNLTNQRYYLMTDQFRAMCAELTDAELANAARKALGEPSYATELHYFLSEDSNEYEPLMLAIRAGIAADRARALLAQPVAKRPTVMEIIELHSWLEDEWRANNDGEDLPTLDFALALLARWNNQQVMA